MRVILNSGPRKGEVQDLSPLAAGAMVADGRASWEFPDQFPPQPVEPPKIAVKKTSRKAS